MKRNEREKSKTKVPRRTIAMATNLLALSVRALQSKGRDGGEKHVQQHYSYGSQVPSIQHGKVGSVRWLHHHKYMCARVSRMNNTVKELAPAMLQSEVSEN